MVDRRKFVLAGGALLLAPGALAQEPPHRVHLIGVLEYASHAAFELALPDFRHGLREGGFIEGKNLRIEYRFADYDYRKLGRLAEELVNAKVQVIYAPTTWPVRAAHAATKTIPIVFSGVNDPVPHKFVESLARPGGNVTGVSPANADLTAKRVQLMRELFPGARPLGVVYDADSAKACGIELRDIGTASRQLGVEVRQLPYDTRSDLHGAFAEAQRAGVAGLLIPTTYETRRYGPDLSAQSSSSRIPLIHVGSEEVDAGGLMSYGPYPKWARQRAGYYIARILSGAKPSDLPVERPAAYELVINLKTARAMEISIPQSILLRADRVIE